MQALHPDTQLTGYLLKNSALSLSIRSRSLQSDSESPQRQISHKILVAVYDSLQYDFSRTGTIPDERRSANGT
jgi:hypothetical protein